MNQSQEKQSKKINMKYFWGHFSAINLFLVAMHKAAVLRLEDVSAKDTQLILRKCLCTMGNDWLDLISFHFREA